jgi:hypothetical protein
MQQADNVFADKIVSLMDALLIFSRQARDIVAGQHVTDPANQLFILQKHLSSFAERLEQLRQFSPAEGTTIALQRLSLLEQALEKLQSKVAKLY